jgi:hypothetical protein
MEKGKMTVPFNLFGEPNVLTVEYGEITSPEKVGFEISKSDAFDFSLSIGFPFMHAYVDSFPKNTYRNLVAFIQTTQSKYFTEVDDMIVSLNEKAVDIPPFQREKQFPFCAVGYPADIYSARFSDLRHFAKLSREINTFLVTFPNPSNNNTVNCLAAFSWGFVEWTEKGKHHVKLLSFKKLNFAYWNHALELLDREFASFEYVRYEEPVDEEEK